MIKHYQPSCLDETLEIAVRFGKTLDHGAVLLFYGDLGSGKTTFIKGIAQGACEIPPNEVVSPTFSLMNVYHGSKALYHFDLYRIKGPEDFMMMGFDEYLYPEGITCIEWSEKIESLLPPSHFCVRIEHDGGDRRLITIDG